MQLDALKRTQTPFTILLILLATITFFAYEITHSISLAHSLVFYTGSVTPYFWTVLIWPLNGMGSPWGLVCSGFWTYQFVGSLERSWGTRQIAILFAITTLISSVAVLIGSKLLSTDTQLAGLFVGSAPATIAWCFINRREHILLYGIIKIPAPFIAAFTLVCVWWMAGTPLIGLFALVASGASYTYAKQGRYRYMGYKSVGNPIETILNHQRRKMGLSVEDFDTGPNATKLNPIIRAYKNWKDARRLAKFFKDSNSRNR